MLFIPIGMFFNKKLPIINKQLINIYNFNHYKFFSSKLLAEYRSRVENGQFQDDSHQTAVLERLLILDEKLKNYQPVSQQSNSSISKLPFKYLFKTSGKKTEKEPEPKCKGLYLHGSVGCGKTMLMDLFFDNCSVDQHSKKRVHFHSFMLDFHSRFHEHIKKSQERSNYHWSTATQSMGRRSKFDFDPIPEIAREIVNESWFICLDEFQVTDIGDAMILKNFFKELFQNGMVMIATSNRPPDELYKNGLQRSNFLPFIPLVKRYCDVYELRSGIDYRRLVDSAKHQIFHVKIDKTDSSDNDTDRRLDLMFKVLCQQENDIVKPKTLTIKGRNVTFVKTCGGILDSSFKELCDQALGAIDYLTISQYYHTVIIRDIPKMTMNLRGQARRFITMIDTFYDHNVRCIFSAMVECDQLFQVQRIDDVLSYDGNRQLMDDLGLSSTKSEDLNVSIFSGEEEMFAFERAISRLYEMQTKEYWNRSMDGAKSDRRRLNKVNRTVQWTDNDQESI